MGIFDMFTAKPQATPQADPATQNPAAAAPNAANQQGNQHVQNNTTVPNSNNTPQQVGPDGKPLQSPVDAFADLWQTAPNQQAPNTNAPIFQLDQQKLAQAVQGMDFASRIPQDAFAKVVAGGEDAVKALAQIVNTVGQAAVSQALVGSASIAEGGIKRYGENITGQLPDLVKRHAVQDSFKQENPALTNPAFAPIVTAVQQQIQTKFPQASATEIRKMTSEYLDGFAGAAGFQKPQQQQEPTGRQAQEQDWSKFLETGSNIFG